MKFWFIKQMATYKSYHRDGRNRAIHHIGVPSIVFSLMVALSYIPITVVADFHITGATLLLFLLLLFYWLSAPTLGCITAIFYIPFLWGADHVARVDPSVGWPVFLGAFVGGWVVQFIGHIIEGRRPAFIDNFVQIVIAPGFLIAEIMFCLGLERELEDSIDGHCRDHISKNLELP